MSLPAYPPPKHIAGAAGPPGPDYDADVIILALDRAEDTVAAIASARSQVGVARHVWIADQGSRPENLALLARAVAGTTDATLVQLDRNWGVAGGRNRATALGTGRCVFALDNDAEFATEDTLAQAVQALRAEPDLAAIGCRILVFATGAEDLSSWGYPPGLLPRAAESFDACTFVGAGHAIRRADFEAAGGYDDALFFCWEEYDFALRAINLGRRIRYRGDIAVRHKVSGERRFAWSGTRWFHFVRNRIYIALKYGDSAPVLLPRFLAYQVKGARNGVLSQGLRAGPAALRLAQAFRPRPEEAGLYRLSPKARDYLARNDSAHRGGLPRRLRAEILAALPGTATR
ncbi:MAG: glycosyltransferase family 2 protein [Paracraurococcus sp.]|jgi:GT2 family glycosyltransferase